ncbi:hypothetical protein H2200_000951 [Cladophialophora chaetospira]|uniref:Caib baif family enzyme n=1 Tax=Cladophialophora chaetospira TaxID=386627 RepID=A0AA39CQU8_9EURO|nr:hypothetical protein H2200_000951 [Cladophialophora chaetospira]
MGSYLEDMPLRLCNIVTPVGMLGYGLDQGQVEQGLEDCIATGVPTAIILDSGSTDGGPSKLALGTMSVPRTNYKRDLRRILSSAQRFQVPVLISSAGGSGSDEHVETLAEICKEIANEPGNASYKLKAITIFAEVSKEIVSERLRKGDITGCGATVPPMTQADIDVCPRILAQMGPEPFVQAMEETPDFNLLIGGRAYDPSPYVAFSTFCFRRLFGDSPKVYSSKIQGGFMHMGKIMECGGLCALPKSNGAIAMLFQDGTFDIRPLSPQSKCTAISVAAHTLYEKSRPDLLYGPGGFLDVTRSTYEELADGRTVRVRGDSFQSSAAQGLRYQIKLEGARTLGYRSMYFGSLRDPILISQLDNFLGRVRAYVQQQHEGIEEAWKLEFHTYDGRSKDFPARSDVLPGEVFLIGEVLAKTQDLAASLADTAAIATIHGPYPGQKATSGNFAHGIGGRKAVDLGLCAEFNIYHLMNLEPGEDLASKKDSANGKGLDQAKEHGLFRWTVRNLENVTPEAVNGDPIHAPVEQPAKKMNVDKRAASKQPELQAHLPRVAPSGPLALGDVASILRSKNAGPYEITFDIMFDTEEMYLAVKNSGFLNQRLIEDLYNLNPKEVIWCGFFDPARAYKCTIPRKRQGQSKASGGFGEIDVHGSTQYIPLFQSTFPEEVAANLRKLLETRKTISSQGV